MSFKVRLRKEFRLMVRLWKISVMVVVLLIWTVMMVMLRLIVLIMLEWGVSLFKVRSVVCWVVERIACWIMSSLPWSLIKSVLMLGSNA